MIQNLEPGSELGAYRIESLLGRGGMGLVYEASHSLLGRKAALKTLAAELAEDGDFRERFIRESQLVAGIDHPNIIPIYDAGESGGIAYIAMRYVQGSDLSQLVERDGPLDLERAIAVLDQAGSALDAAHAREVLHRDVKPANILIDENADRIYLTDFGIAKDTTARGVTRTGFFMGTVDYAAPEQIHGKDLTTAADIYAFGCMFFEVVTGRKPFEKESDFAVMQAHLEESPPLASEAMPGLPPSLDTVIGKAMAKAPDERYESCRELVDAARAASGARPTSGAPSAVFAASPSFGAAPSFAGAPVAQGKAMSWQDAIAGKTAAPQPKERIVKLPPVPDTIVGRDADLEEIASSLADQGVRMLTITGLGGVGKTRLAVEAATRIAETADGASGGFDAIHFVDLSTVNDPGLVGSAIATAIGAEETRDRPLVEVLAEKLGTDRTLLVLDNFEHVLGASSLVGDLLAAADSLEVLVTSQAPLHLRGEHEYPLAPLSLPPRGARDLDAVAASSAVALFVERAQAVKPNFELTPENAADVGEIARQLDGLPLAIELAAARLKLLTPQAMLARLEKRLDLLTGGTGQQQALRSTIDWSYQLLDANERTMLARLSVFAGGCSLEGAEGVCATGELTIGEVMDGLASLVDKSLLRQEEDAQGEPRFRLLETIREYALDQLEERGEADEIRRRHAERYVALAEAAEPELVRPGQAGWLARLDDEYDNIRAALTWSVESGNVEHALRLAGSLVRYWSVRGLMTEGRRWLDAALARGADVAAPVRVKALFSAGYAAIGQGDFLQAQPFFEQSLALAQEIGDERGQAAALAQLGWLVMSRGAAERAAALSQQSLELARAVGDKHSASGALNILADVAAAGEEYARATQLFEESLSLRRELGDKRLIANSLLTLARHELNREQFERATELLDEGLALARELRDTWQMSVALGNLARVQLHEGSHEAAQALFAEALALARDRGDKRVAAECLQGIAASASGGAPDFAAHVWGAAQGVLEATGATLMPAERAIEEEFLPPLKTALGEAAFDAAIRAGRLLTFEEAVERALAGSPRVVADAGATTGA